MNYDEDADQQLVLLGDFEEALGGVCMDVSHRSAAVYSTQKILDILVWRDRMDPAEAFEYFNSHIFTHLNSEGNPLFLKDLRYELIAYPVNIP